jgi:hypothetical protein
MDTQIRPRNEGELTEREEQLHLIDKLAYLRRRRENILDDLVSVDEEIDRLQVVLSQPI